MWAPSFAALILFSLLLAQSEAQPPEVLVARLQASRAAKDSLLRHSPDSPIPPALRSQFPGLSYFPVDLRYRLTGDLHVYGRQRLLAVPTTDGNSITLERFGRFVAQWQGAPFSLEVYRSPEDGTLLIFFKDATNGAQTYGGGRYVQLEREEKGRYILDFNYAYNPYCAYNADYVCPLPPPQNYLSFPVLAGEKKYGADLAH